MEEQPDIQEVDLSRSEIERLNEAEFGLTRPKLRFKWPDDKETDRIYGIDVSHHQCSIEWEKVKAADPAFVYVRATLGQTVEDREHKANFQGAIDFEIVKGSYHFLTRSGDPKDQVDRFLKRYEPYVEDADLPPCVDFEPYYVNEREQWERIPRSERIDKLATSLEHVEQQHGRKPIIYTNGSAWNRLLGTDGNIFQGYKIWIARYGGYKDEDPNVMDEFEWWLWQFTELGEMPGITKNTVDSNIVKRGDDLDPYSRSPA